VRIQQLSAGPDMGPGPGTKDLVNMYLNAAAGIFTVGCQRR
jgi:hypothetical protein